jgi:hypothetical protein
MIAGQRVEFPKRYQDCPIRLEKYLVHKEDYMSVELFKKQNPEFYKWLNPSKVQSKK